MKRILKLMAVSVLLLVSFASCTDAKHEVKMAVLEMNNQCPIEFEQGITCVGANVVDDNVVVNYVFDESIMPFDKMNFQDELVKRAQASMVVSNEEFANKIISAGYGLKIIFKGAKTKKEISIILTNEQLKDASKHPLSLSEQLVVQIAQTQACLPMKADEITLITNLKLEGDDVVYTYEVDDDEFDFSIFLQIPDQVKENLRSELAATNSPSSISRNFLKLVRRTNKNLSYIYISKNTGQKFEVKFTNSELREMANDYVEED